jgi:hypothetical protein
MMTLSAWMMAVPELFMDRRYHEAVPMPQFRQSWGTRKRRAAKMRRRIGRGRR